MGVILLFCTRKIATNYKRGTVDINRGADALDICGETKHQITPNEAPDREISSECRSILTVTVAR